MKLNVTIQSPRLLTDILKRDGSNFDILRLVAALGVIVGHAYEIAPHPPLQDGVSSLLHFDYSGSLAVKFFFFLSGLLVTNSLISKPNTLQFLIKRAFRIFPGLLVCLVVSVFIIGPIFTKLSLVDYFENRDTWKYLTHNFFLVEIVWRLPEVFSVSKYGLNGSLWTLPYEVLCYIYLAVFFGLGIMKNKVVSNIIFILIIGISFLNPAYLPSFFAQNQDAHLLPGCFAIGSLFANNKKYVPITIIYFLLVWALVYLLKNTAIYQFLFYVALFYSAILISSLPIVIKHLKLPFDASYGVYVYGFLIQQCIYNLFPNLGIHEHQLLAATIAIAMGIFSWYLIEKKFISLGNHLTRKIETGNLKNKVNKAIENGLSYFKNVKINQISIFIPLCILLVVTAIMHAIVLKFIYPGYYSPLYPQHSDFYIPAMLANSSLTFSNLLSWPRPVNWIFAKFIGYFGIKGSIVWIIAVVCLNCTLTALFLIRLFKFQINWKLIIAYCIYCYLIFSQPFFYVFYAQNIGGQLSYLFLISGSFLLYAIFNKPAIIGNFMFFLFCLLAFLSVESFGLTSLCFGFLWFIYYWKISLTKAILPIVSIAAAGIVALAFNIFTKSTFVNLHAAAGSSYEISFNPWSILKEWFLYAKEAMNIANVLILILLTFLLLKDQKLKKKEIIFVVVACFAGSALSWLPNALLPNHHYTGYSFNGAYLLYLPCLFLAVLWANKNINWKIFAAIIFLGLISPLLNISKYKKNRWVLQQEQTQRNLLHALKPLMKGIPVSNEPQKILIEGITFPFHPFAFPQSLRVFPNAKYANFDIVNYDTARLCGLRTDLVKFVNMKDIILTNYQQKWIFEKDGKLHPQQNLLGEKSLNNSHYFEQTLLINQKNFSKYTTSGFYEEENNFRWTNGKAAIQLNEAIVGADSLIIILNTYLPPICKDIHPQLFLSGSKNTLYKPSVTTRLGDVFSYLFVPEKEDTIKQINILSEIINSSSDQRVLSFPFKSMETKIIWRQNHP